ncbi:Uncharacterised protein [Serratia odorifera]|uniref:Uncharacterized protein n=1 Tax=Serratia odorifera TaxID=618 RepID=A0A447KK91_SEROD|nr:Uncharacterised protein [Serratia odorifera]
MNDSFSFEKKSFSLRDKAFISDPYPWYSVNTDRILTHPGVRMFSWTDLLCDPKLSPIHFRANCAQRQFNTSFVIPPDVSIHMLHEVFQRHV